MLLTWGGGVCSSYGLQVNGYSPFGCTYLVGFILLTVLAVLIFCHCYSMSNTDFLSLGERPSVVCQPVGGCGKRGGTSYLN